MSNAEYQRLHKWIREQLGKAGHCSIDPSHKASVYHWSNISGKYKWDVNDFRSLCPSCHRKTDYTEAEREFIRQRSLGNQYHNTPVVRIDPATGVTAEYGSLEMASKTLGVIRTAISNCLAGRTRTAGGFKWQYKETQL